jgi:hypothetical protein
MRVAGKQVVRLANEYSDFASRKVAGRNKGVRRDITGPY